VAIYKSFVFKNVLRTDKVFCFKKIKKDMALNNRYCMLII